MSFTLVQVQNHIWLYPTKRKMGILCRTASAFKAPHHLRASTLSLNSKTPQGPHVCGTAVLRYRWPLVHCGWSRLRPRCSVTADHEFPGPLYSTAGCAYFHLCSWNPLAFPLLCPPSTLQGKTLKSNQITLPLEHHSLLQRETAAFPFPSFPWAQHGKRQKPTNQKKL